MADIILPGRSSDRLCFGAISRPKRIEPTRFTSVGSRAAAWGFSRGSARGEVPCWRKSENRLTLHDVWGTVKTNLLEAGVDKTYRDLILGHSLEGMDRHSI